MSVKTAHSKIRIIFLISIFAIMYAVTFATTHADSNKINTLSDIFTKGQFHGQIRNYYMATIHHSALPNYWTNAVGSSLHFQTANIHGFTAGIKGNISYQTLSSELYNNETPGLSAKWESELYDRNETDFDQLHSRFDEIYLRYSTKKLSIKAGRQNINKAPLLQQLDGRMMPFVYQGIWSEYQHDEGKTYLGLINGIGPRGMTNWYSLNEGIGIIGKGLQPNGTPSNYYKKSNTRGLIVAGHEQKIGDNWKINYWTNWLDRIYGIQWFESHFENENMIAGIQYVFQHALPKQKELEYNQRYYQPGENANILAARLGMKISKWQLTGNYLHSFEGGRFLYPRELGRDNFFTSEPRSWQDGFGESDVLKLKANYFIENTKVGKLDAGIAFNRVFSVSQSDFKNNKYAIPPYNQFTADIRYKFKGILQGLDLRFLFVHRTTEEKTPINLSNKFYRTDFSHYNLIANINF